MEFEDELGVMVATPVAQIRREVRNAFPDGELPAVLDVDAAMAEGAPVLHPDFNSYFGFQQKMEKPSNVYHRTSRVKGDVEAGFAEADVVVEGHAIRRIDTRRGRRRRLLEVL